MVDFGVRTISLSQGYVALVDESAACLVEGRPWHIEKKKGGLLYAISRHKRAIVWMHRLILGVPDGVLVDHRDGNGLNNRRSNLRPATKTQNAQNSRPSLGFTSRFKGVGWYRGRNRSCWRARIRVDGTQIHLGIFDSEEEAARCYDAAALRLFGEFARLNFPSPQEAV